MKERQFQLIDHVLGHLNDAMQTIFGEYQSARPNPAEMQPDHPLSADQIKQSVGYMRVNHSGEVCAQALYQGQLAVAKNEKTRDMLAKACDEETDHLAWTFERLQELKSHRSYLNVFWYTNSYLIGMVAGLFGDKWSLGFVEETENQVGQHLQGHLDRIAKDDKKSRAIIELMKEDEAHHGAAAAKAGAVTLPFVVKGLMRLQSKVLTTLAYYL